MNYEVELYNPEYVDRGPMHVDETVAQATVVVDSVHFDGNSEYWVRLVGTDPSCYPDLATDRDRIGETRMWTSKKLTLHLKPEDPLEVHSVAPTDKDVPEPEVSY